MHRRLSQAIGCSEVIKVIKTFRLGAILFVLLIIATLVAAVAALLTGEKSGSAAAGTLGEGTLPVLVIDAGHGGEDGGAVALSGIHESAINLEIAKKLAALAELTGLPYVMTRDSEDITYPDSAVTTAKRKVYDTKRRAELVNTTPNAVLLSVHQNFFPQGSVHGPQAFYAPTDGSNTFAALVQETMNSTVAPLSRRVCAPAAKNIYLMKSVTCPAVLVECGFISNKDESALLCTDAYRLKVALALTGAYLQYLSAGEGAA